MLEGDVTRAVPPSALVRFRALFDAEFAYVCRSLRRFGVHERDLDDAAQELFVRVYERFDDLDPSRPPRPWLLSFAFRVASNYRRLARHKGELVGNDALDLHAGGGDAEAALAEGQARSLLMRALGALSFERRDVFVLHDLDELPAPEVARILELPVNTVYSRLRRARADLDAELERLARESGGGP